jgi:hypothetical protein
MSMIVPREEYPVEIVIMIIALLTAALWDRPFDSRL